MVTETDKFIAERIFAFTVVGKPQQRGSKISEVVRNKDGIVWKHGRPVLRTRDANKHSKAWMKKVAIVGAEAFSGNEIITSSVDLIIRFYFERPKVHYRTGRYSHLLKPQAPVSHTQFPDLDKLVRSVGDALTGVVWKDDAQIDDLNALKSWTTEEARVEISVIPGQIIELKDIPL